MNPYQEHLNRDSDIREHLGLLHGLAMNKAVQLRVVELGFRTGVSTSAFLAAGAHVTSYDIDKCRSHVQHLAKVYPDTFVFKQGDSRTCDIPKCNLLFIDTDHTYATTLAELNRHHLKVGQTIVLHDTETFGHKDRKPGTGPGLMQAIGEFNLYHDWCIRMHLQNCNGLTILKRRS